MYPVRIKRIIRSITNKNFIIKLINVPLTKCCADHIIIILITQSVNLGNHMNNVLI